MANRIQAAEIIRAQEFWGKQLVALGQCFRSGKDFREPAERFVSELYGYAEGPVLFKPTRAHEMQFRLTPGGALSYFIGGDAAFPEDHGFALRPWEKVRFENAGFLHYESGAVAMGNYFFSDYQGTEIQAEFTLGFTRTGNGSLKINLHHSSLPFHPEDPRCH